MGRLFGTDGARGVANVDLTPELAMSIGRAAATVLTKGKKTKSKVLIGKDTRISSDMLEGALIAGFCSVGIDVISLGVVPTPAVAYLVKKYNADAGAMISASHNSYEFNGIKLFNADGYKLPDILEEEMEAIILDGAETIQLPQNDGIGKHIIDDDAINDYIDHLKSTITGDLSGLKVAFDCSNGSASRTAYELFTSLGVKCFMLNNDPNGININKNCGSVHIDGLIDFVKANKLDLGIAFDGDADRCLAVDDTGALVDGDIIMAICAKSLKSRKLLKKDTVVGTVMTNMGFNSFCRDNNISFISSKVGDRYVLEDMLRGGYNFGGEQSGHVIFLDFATTGDGQLTAVQLLNIIKVYSEKLSQLKKVMTKYPQVIENVKVSQEGKLRFYIDDVIKNAIEKAENQYEDGRILVRPSGTEPLIRVMMEGKDKEKISKTVCDIANIIKFRLM